MAKNFMWHAVEVLIHCRDNACRNIQNFNLSQAQLCNSHVEDPSVRILPQFGRLLYSMYIKNDIYILVLLDTGWNTFLKGKTLYSGTSKHAIQEPQNTLFRNIKTLYSGTSKHSIHAGTSKHAIQEPQNTLFRNLKTLYSGTSKHSIHEPQNTIYSGTSKKEIVYWNGKSLV